MLKVENVEVNGIEAAIRGMRNPMNSWDKSDSTYVLLHNPDEEYEDTVEYALGKNDLELMQRLFRAGTEHRKYLRFITVSMDITSNHVFWSEFDTYKVGTVRNSCSKMHKIHVKAFNYSDFSHEGIDAVGGVTKAVFFDYILKLEDLRQKYNETQSKKYWRALIEMLPCGFNIKATVLMNYEVCANIVRQRKNHKLEEWHTLCNEIMQLPYFMQITEGI